MTECIQDLVGLLFVGGLVWVLAELFDLFNGE